MTDISTTFEPELNGLVLVGGKSSRMGRPKAYLDFGKGPQWQVSDAMLKSVCCSVYFSVSKELDPPLPVNEDRVIRDVFLNPIGPLGGILSAFKLMPKTAFFVLACDVPFFDEKAMRALLLRRNLQKKATAFIHDDKVEPLCAIYEPHILEDLALAWAHGNYCPKAILSNINIERVIPDDIRSLANINYAYEFDAIIENSDLKKTVVVYYYASIRESVKKSEEQVETSAYSIEDLFLELKKKYDLAIGLSSLRFAKNNRLVTKDEPIKHNDEVVFIPPVSGG